MNDMLKKLGYACIVLVVSACTVGPDYQRPDTDVPGAWQTSLETGSALADDDYALWWHTFEDPLLNTLIDEAKRGNQDLFQAEARIREAKARRRLAGAELWPTSSMSMSATRNEYASSSSGSDSEVYRHSIDASWELDLFGKKRRSVEAAEASEQAAQEDLRDILVSLLAEVALNYVDMRAYQTRIEITEANLAAQQETYNITRWRHMAGLTTELDVEQARLTVENTRAELPVLRTSLAQARHTIALLLGQDSAALTERLSADGKIPAASGQVAVGIPADLLRRRPDLRRAERQLAAQTAQIGVAEAERYPDITLSGSIGLQSLEFTNLYSAAARTSQVAANGLLTLFDAGRISSNVAIQTALQEQALGLYRATLLTALRDVEDALIAYIQEQERRQALANAVTAGSNALELAEAQYQSGLIDFQPVLEAQRALLTSQTQYTVSQAELASNVIRLYKALGGGWQTAAIGNFDE